MNEPRIPPRPAADWDAEVFDALSVLRPPGAGRPAMDRAGTGPQRAPREQAGPVRVARRPIPNILGIFAWHPALAKAFLAFNSQLFASSLTGRERELVTLRVAWLRRGEYEWAQHVPMARAEGLSVEEIDAISEGPDSAAWGPRDAVLLASVDEIVADRHVRDDTWRRLAALLDRRQLMDLVFTIGTYDMLAMACNVFGIELDPGLAGFPDGGNSEPTSR